MTDLVERLRSAEVFIMTGGMVSLVAEEAATEIEKLRAARRESLTLLRDLTTAWDASRLGDNGHHAMIRRAHAIIAHVEGGAA